MVPPAQSVQLGVIVPGMVPLFSHAPVAPLVYVASGTVVYASAAAQSKVVGSVGNVSTAGGAGVTVMVAVRERVVTIIDTSIINGDGTTSTERPVVGDRPRDGTTVLTSTRSAIGICGDRYGSVMLQRQHNPKLLAVLAT